MDGSATAATISLAGLYREHAGFVWRTVRRLGMPVEFAEDVVQEVFIVARNKLPEYAGRGSPKSWLFGIARGVCANVRRSRDRAARPRPLVPVEQPPGPEEAMGTKDAVRLVESFLVTLPDDQRIVFELADIEGMSGPEIAQSLGVKLNSVYSRLRLARRRFEKYLAQNQRGRNSDGHTATLA